MSANAVVQFAGDDLFIGVGGSGHAHLFDTSGERKRAPSPMEMLLSAIGACTAADVVSILAKKRQRVTAYRVEVKGERREEFPRRYQAIHIHHIVTGHGVSQSAVASAVELSDQKYCSVAASLRPTVRISTSFEIIEEADHARTGDA